MITSFLLILIAIAGLLLLLTAILSPIETLSWWAGWTEDEINDAEASPDFEDAPSAQKTYIVYLAGIASISGRYQLPRERTFIRKLEARFPDAVIIDNVFPYSPAGLPLLAAPRFFDRLWRWIQKLKLEGRQTLLSPLINARNVFQVMISADHRYGPIFNQGAARVIENALIEAGYKRYDRSARVVIIGYSGGAQIAAGASPFLTSRYIGPIDIISIGGVMASDPGFHFVRRFHHVVGQQDRVEKVGAIMFPERWKAMAHSEWNTAKRDGRVIFHKLANMIHAGARGYFGLPKINGISNNDRTLELVADILEAAD